MEDIIYFESPPSPPPPKKKESLMPEMHAIIEMMEVLAVYGVTVIIGFDVFQYLSNLHFSFPSVHMSVQTSLV